MADVFAHAVAHDYILADAKYRVMLDWFNDWVKRISEPPYQFGRFINIKRLGAGGFGVVFQADDTRRLDEHGNPMAVAIKLPHAMAIPLAIAFGTPTEDTTGYCELMLMAPLVGSVLGTYIVSFYSRDDAAFRYLLVGTVGGGDLLIALRAVGCHW